MIWNSITLMTITDLLIIAGACIGVGVFYICSRKRANRISKIGEARLANAQRIAGLGSWNRDMVTGEIHWSDEMYRIFGLAPGAFGATYQAFLDTLHPDDRKLVDGSITAAIRHKTSFSVDYRIVPAGGGVKIVHAQGEVMCDQAGTPVRMSGTVQDITERRQTEDALREAEQRFRDFAEASSDWFWELGPDLRFTSVSDRLVEASGLPREHFIGKTSRDLGTPLDEPGKWARYLAQLAAHEPVRGYYFTRRKGDGSERHIRLNGKPFFAPDGAFRGYRGTGREFNTESGAAEQVERARDRFMNAIEHISEGIALFDENDRLVFSNGHFRDFALAEETRQAIGMTFEEIVRTNMRAGLIAVPGKMAEEWINWRIDRFHNPGEPFELVVAGRHLLIREQRLPEGGSICTYADITEIREREEQLRQAQKMEVVGQLTGGVAHDFNNLLVVITGNLELLGERLAGQENLLEFVRRSLDATDRGATLTQQLLAFSRKQPMHPQIVELVGVINDLPSTLLRMLGENITVKLAVPDDVWPVFVDPVQLENAILNLAVNARDAMEAGGQLTIEAANRTVGSEDALRLGALVPGDYVMIAVSDTGAGMTPEIVEKVFEPFFTTKPVGKGSGLGLSMVYGFSRQSHGGAIIYSEPDRGTSVKMFLPRSIAAAANADAGRREIIVAGKGEFILVDEDDPAVRDLATDLLDSLNYRVIAATDGPAALDKMDEVGAIDLLFTDIVLPRNMDGVELARRARSRKPGLKVLYTSGYTENAFSNGAQNTCAPSDGTELLTKPYHKATLARSIRNALDNPARV